MKFIKDKKKLFRIKGELHWCGSQERGKCKKKTNNTEDKKLLFSCCNSDSQTPHGLTAQHLNSLSGKVSLMKPTC